MDKFRKIKMALLIIEQYWFVGIQDRIINGVNIKYFR